MAKNIITGIDIGSATIKVMVAEKMSDDTLRVLGVGHADSHGIRKGCVANGEEATTAVKEAVEQAERTSGLPIKHAYVAFGGIGLGSVRNKGVVAVSRADSEITEHDTKRAIDIARAQIASLANKEIVHAHPIYFTIDGELSAKNPVGMVGARLEVETNFTTGLVQHINALVKSVESAGISIDDIIATPLAASRAVLSKKHKEVGVVMLDIGGATTSLVVYEEGVPLSTEVFPVGSGHITNDIAIGFKVSLEEAEKMKYDFSAEKSRKGKLADIIDARLSDVFELVDKHLKKIGRSRLLPAGTIITGGGANLGDVAEFAKKGLQLPAEVAGPGDEIKSAYSGLQDPEWSAVSGLCLMGSDEENFESLGLDVVRRTNGAVIKWLKAFLP